MNPQYSRMKESPVDRPNVEFNGREGNGYQPKKPKWPNGPEFIEESDTGTNGVKIFIHTIAECFLLVFCIFNMIYWYYSFTFYGWNETMNIIWLIISNNIGSLLLAPAIVMGLRLYKSRKTGDLS